MADLHPALEVDQVARSAVDNVGLLLATPTSSAGVDWPNSRAPVRTGQEQPMPEGTRHPMLEHLDPLVGEWTTEATHQLMPGTVVRGEATFEWLEGGHFLIERSRNDHPDFPDAVSIFGPDDPGDSGGWEGCSLHYFDSRGVSRVYTLDAEPGVFRFTRDWPGFSQRFTGTISADGDTIAGVAELCEDGTTWQVDLRLNYSRVR